MGNEGLLAALLGVSRGAGLPTTTLNMAVPPATSAYASLLGSLLATPATPAALPTLGAQMTEAEMQRFLGAQVTESEMERLRQLLTGAAVPRSY